MDASKLKAGDVGSHFLFNVNESVRVRLTPFGERAFYKYWQRIFPGEERKPNVDADGYARFQLWDLMQIFGPHHQMTNPPCFEGNNILFNAGDFHEATPLTREDASDE